MRRHRLLIATLLLTASSALRAELPTEVDADRAPRLRTGGDVVLLGATVHTVSGEVLEEASVVVRDGRISAVVTGEVVPPDGVVTIDVRGLHVTPGIIDCHSHIAIRGGTNESSASVTAEVRIEDEVDGDDLAIYRALAGGCTTANLLHGSANAIGGQNAVVKLKYRRPGRQLLFPGAPRGIKFALGENPARKSSSGSKRYPTSRMGVEATIRRTFVEGREYAEAWDDYHAALERGEDPEEPRRDLRLEAIAGVLSGEVLVHCHCYRAPEILMLIRLAEEFGFRIATFQHVLEGYKVAPEIAAHGAGASAFSDWWAYKAEAYDAIPYNAAMMARAGVVVSLNSDSSELMRRLNTEAAKAVKYGGVDDNDALAMVTLNPAKQLGIDHKVGSIEVGKDADLVVWSGHPLSVFSKCLYALVDGEVEFMREGAPSALDVDVDAIGSITLDQPPAETAPVARDVAPRSVARLAGSGRLAITGARVVPVSSPPIEADEKTAVLIKDGRVEAVLSGDEAVVPDGYEVVDATGRWLYPGMIDPATSIGLTEISSVPGTVDTREQGTDQADLRVAVAVQPDSAHVGVARANGVLSAVVRPRGALICGQSALLRLDGRTWEEMALVDPLALCINTPGWGSGGKGDDDARTTQLLDAFSAARDRAARREAGERIAQDPRVDALLPYAELERPVVFEADDEKAIAQAVSLAGRLGVRPIISGGREAWKVADLLARHDVPVFVGPVLTNPAERHDPYDSPFANAAILYRAGVRFAFQTAGSSAVRNLPQHAGMAAAFGLDREEALAAVTLRAAEILGVDQHLGSIAPGRIADLVLTDGDLLEVRTQVVGLFVGGRPAPVESRHTRLRDRFAASIPGG